MSKTVTPQELKERVGPRKVVTIIDVRRKADYDADREAVSGAEWRDPEKVDEWSKDLPADKEVVVYCVRGGTVSNQVVDRLLDKKINAHYIEGGITAWKESGGKTKKKQPRAAVQK
jgi:rhodanese-related sulfurtransferase